MADERVKSGLRRALSRIQVGRSMGVEQIYSLYYSTISAIIIPYYGLTHNIYV